MSSYIAYPLSKLTMDNYYATFIYDLFSVQQHLAILREKVADWAETWRPTSDQANGILQILNTMFPLIPRDVCTLLGTEKSVIVSEVLQDYRELASGQS